MDVIMISDTNPSLEHVMKSHVQGSLVVGSHEEKAAIELEELKVESHDSREWPSWFRAEMDGHKEILRNKIKRVNALVDMMRWCSATVVSHPNIAALVSLSYYALFSTMLGY